MLLPGGEQNAADRLNGSALAADNAAHIGVSYANLNTDVFAVRTLGHLNLLGFADQRFDDLFYSLFHKFVEFVELIEFIENKRLNELKELNKLFRNCCFSRIVLDQALDRLGRLCSDADPVIDAIVI